MFLKCLIIFTWNNISLICCNNDKKQNSRFLGKQVEKFRYTTTAFSILITQKLQTLSCVVVAANERHDLCSPRIFL